MRILVTGGAGFIGSWVVIQLLQRPGVTQVINLDALTYAGNPDNLKSVDQDPRYRFVHGDIRNPRLVNELMAEADACVHVAAETHVDRSITGPLVFTETNVMGTHILLEAARQHKVGKFVLVSTDEVYGELSLDTDDQFTESTPLTPNSPYSASKAAADMLARCYFETYGLPVCITRCGNNYGPHQYPEKLIPFFTLRALRDETLPVYGDGKYVRDWIHVHDHASGILAVLDKGQPGESYNIGADNQQDNMTITYRILEILGKPQSLIQFVKDRPGHDRRYALDTTKIRTQLGWSPQFEFDSGLQDTILWYQNNPQWIEAIQTRQHQEKIPAGATWLTDSGY